MSLTLFGVPSSQAGIPFQCPTQSFDYGGDLVCVQGLDCHLGLNYFYILCSGQMVVIFKYFGKKDVWGTVSPNIFQVRPNVLSYDAVPSEAPYYHTLLSRVEVLQQMHFGTHNSKFFWARSCLDYCAITDRYGLLLWSTKSSTSPRSWTLEDTTEVVVSWQIIHGNGCSPYIQTVDVAYIFHSSGCSIYSPQQWILRI